MSPKEKLDRIQEDISHNLKPLGFRKRGRTFNRRTDKRIVQVINFQMGQFPIGNQEIPGLRESFYGKFTINLGILIEDLFILNAPGELKSFYQEYDCQIRKRLSHLLFYEDKWWTLSEEIDTELLFKQIEGTALNWLYQFSTLDAFFENWSKAEEITAKLNYGIMKLKIDREEGSRIVRDYINELGDLNTGHKQYVINLATELGVNLKE